jgi:hypothetical protein
LTDTEVVFHVNEIEVARYSRSSVAFIEQDNMYRLEGAEEPIFFQPVDREAFQRALTPLSPSERIAMASTQAAAPQPAAAPGASPAKPLWQRWWFITGAVLILLAAIGSTLDGTPEVEAGATTTSTEVPSSTTEDETTTTSAESTTSSSPTSTSTTTTLAGPEIVFGDGLQIVGEDVQAGIYETGLIDGTFGCYWERLSGLSGSFDELIANNNAVVHDVVEIKASDTAFDSDCGGWFELTALEEPLTTVPEGKWVIDAHIAPGTYEAPGSDSCYWERLSGVSGEFEDISANDLPSGRAIVEIAPSDFAFNSSGCGDWTPR